jgi:hypothetical protein
MIIFSVFIVAKVRDLQEKERKVVAKAPKDFLRKR